MSNSVRTHRHLVKFGLRKKTFNLSKARKGKENIEFVGRKCENEADLKVRLGVESLQVIFSKHKIKSSKRRG